jgi:hypothetical protein
VAKDIAAAPTTRTDRGSPPAPADLHDAQSPDVRPLMATGNGPAATVPAY